MKVKNYVLSVICGALMTFAFPPYSVIGVCFVLYSIFFALLLKANNKKQLLGVGFAFGFGTGSASMSWLINALLIDVQSFGWAIPLVPVGFGIFFGLFTAVAALLCVFGKTPLMKLLAFAGAMTILEWVRSWFLTGFPWNLVGSVWSDYLPVLQTVSVVGIYGLSLLSIIWFCAPYFIYKRLYKQAIVIILSFAVVAGLGALRLYTSHLDYEWGIKLRLVQPNIPQDLKWNPQAAEDNFLKLIHLSKSTRDEKITHVIWPEAASPYLLDVDENARAMTISALQQDALLITGSLRLADPQSHQIASSIMVINDVGEIIRYYDKSHLVPFGEYMPLRGWLNLEKLVPIGADFKAGNGVKTIGLPNAPKVGLLDCYEVIFPHEVVDEKHRPNWIVNVTNDTWYGLSAGPYQHLASAQTRAVEEGLPLIRVANSGISAVISPYGEILHYLPLGSQGVMDVRLPKAIQKAPFYAQKGNIIPLGMALACLLIAFFNFFRQKDTIKD